MGCQALFSVPQSFTLGLHMHPTLPPQEACRPWPRAEETCLGTRLTPREAVISLASQGKLREADVPTALSPAAGLVMSQPRSGQGRHPPSSVLGPRVLLQASRPTPGQPSSNCHFPGLHLRCKLSRRGPHPSPSPPKPVNLPGLQTVPASDRVPVRFVLHPLPWLRHLPFPRIPAPY